MGRVWLKRQFRNFSELIGDKFCVCCFRCVILKLNEWLKVYNKNKKFLWIIREIKDNNSRANKSTK